MFSFDQPMLPQALKWLMDSLVASGFTYVTVNHVTPCLALFSASKEADQSVLINLLVGANGLLDPFIDDAVELSLTYTKTNDLGEVVAFHDFYDREANPFSLFVRENDDELVDFREIILLNLTIARMRDVANHDAIAKFEVKK